MKDDKIKTTEELSLSIVLKSNMSITEFLGDLVCVWILWDNDRVIHLIKLIL